MQQLNQDTMVKLSKKQLSEAILSQLSEENGLNDVFKMTLEGLMLLYFCESV
jgi:hypothetical protein